MANNVICRKVFELGKIAYTNPHRKANAVTVEMELRQHGGDPTFTIENGKRIPTGKSTPEYVELSICGNVWNTRRTDIVCGGQCLDTILRYVLMSFTIGNRKLFYKLYSLWKGYHLNGMHTGTPEQEAAIKAWEACGHEYDYKEACEFLKEIDLYEIPFTGKTIGKMYNGEMYRYGSGWVVQDLPESVIETVKAMCA